MRGREQKLPQGSDALAGDRGHRQDIGAGQGRRLQDVCDLCLDLHASVGVDQVAFGQGNDAPLDAKKIDDRQMLGRLRHDAIIGGDDEQHEIDAGRAGQHIVNKAIMSRHIDKTDHLALAGRKIGKAEVDGDSTLFFFQQPVGIDTGQRAHERGLAMVDMACRPDNHATGSGNGLSASARARAISSGDREVRAASRNGAASSLPASRPRNSQARAATRSRGTPAPR